MVGNCGMGPGRGLSENYTFSKKKEISSSTPEIDDNMVVDTG